MRYAVVSLVIVGAAVLTICAVTLEGGSLAMVAAAMVILAICGTAPVALGVLVRRRSERVKNLEREEIIRIRDSAARQVEGGASDGGERPGPGEGG